MFSWQIPAWVLWRRAAENLPHAILLQSGDGFGELEFAQSVAGSLLCEDPLADGRACGRCQACGWFSMGNHPDFRLLIPESMAQETEEGAEAGKKRSEQIRIEQIRELSDFLAVGTHRAGLRVILIYPAEAMNPNTQNALLKNLEEPPPSTVFLLVTTQSDRLLPTVRSRCMKLPLAAPDRAKALSWLKGEGVDDPEAALAAVGGAPLAALKAAQSDGERRAFVDGLMRVAFDPIALGESVQRVPPWDVVAWLQRWSFDLLLAQATGQVRYHPGQEKSIAEISRRCEPARVATYLRRLAEAKALARHPLNARLFVEDLLLQYQRLVEQ
jgi:DNA polymerase-3 subunit delta'